MLKGLKPKSKDKDSSNVQPIVKNKDELDKPKRLAIPSFRDINKYYEEGESKFYPLAYRLLAKRVKFLFPRFVNLESKLKQAGTPVHYEAYICGLVLMSLLAGTAGVIGGLIINFSFSFSPPELGMLFPFFLGSAGSQGLFGFMFYYPNILKKSRATRLQTELPYYIGYMATLAASGLGLEAVFRAIAKDESSNEEIVKDARMMARNLDLLGMDVLTSLKDLISRSPQGMYTEMLEGLITTVESGGKMKEYFIATAKVQLEEKKLLLKKMTESLGMISEIYTILLIVFPLLAVIMLAIMAIMTPNLGGFSLTTLMKGVAYAFVPLFGTMLLMMMDTMVPKR